MISNLTQMAQELGFTPALVPFALAAVLTVVAFGLPPLLRWFGDRKP